MKRLLAAAAFFTLLPAEARATEWMICSAGEAVSFSVLLGAMDVIAVNDIKIAANGKKWSTSPGEGTLITRGQAFETADQMWIDVTDEGMGKVVAQLRLFKADANDTYAVGGTLRIDGEGAWAVACDGP